MPCSRLCAAALGMIRWKFEDDISSVVASHCNVSMICMRVNCRYMFCACVCADLFIPVQLQRRCRSRMPKTPIHPRPFGVVLLSGLVDVCQLMHVCRYMFQGWSVRFSSLDRKWKHMVILTCSLAGEAGSGCRNAQSERRLLQFIPGPLVLFLSIKSSTMFDGGCMFARRVSALY